ncbi:MAG TPA: PP2C family protein-serine/threonine phosphatase, partial [Candidatus Ozemobacteraceae bacterium]|nr:PP2C family protein-serine/threonine phosphatase [Candidatus Ozemobacteraceae bacterium]
ELPEVQSDTEEIHTLAESFHNLAFSLHEQAEINKTYLKTIQKLTEIYSELESDKAEMVGINKEARLENAVGKVLELLRDTLPGIGLVKIMRKSPESVETPAGFLRLGAPQFTQEFLSSHEYFPYAASTGLPTDHRQDQGREFLPLHEGLTGWYCDNKMLGIQCSDDDRSFFRRSLPLPAIQDNPVLRGRTHEQGLNGCLLLLPLLTPIQAGEATLLSDPEYDEVLFVYFPDPDTRLSLQDVSFIKIIADQLASIIETDKLMTAADKKKKLDTQLQMAREIQENLLPQKTPVIPGLGISRISKSAAEVGGDYYDFFDLGSKRLGLVIADASGKNVPAAIIMTVFKTTLSTMELTKLSAGEVLTRANDIIQLNITNDRFITAMYAIIDATTGEVELACAGHNPAVVVSRRNGPPTLEERSASGLPLGIVSMKYQPTRFTMKPGDLLVLYTDGVTEARNPDAEEYGAERLKRFLGGQQRTDPARALLDDIGLFTGDAPQYDDITAVTVEFKGNKP